MSDREIETMAEDDGRARLTRSQDRLHLTLQALEPDDEDPPRLIRHELDLLIGPNVVISLHDGPIQALDRFVAGLDGETRLGALRAADLLSSLVDEVFAGYFLVVEMVEREIDALDQRALRGSRRDDVLTAIVGVRHRVAVIRRTLAPHREAIAAMARPEMQVEEAIGQPWPGLSDRLERAMDAVEGLRQSLLGTYDVHMGRVAQRANDVMKALTVMSGVLLPGVVLAGLMGMNFKEPLFDDPQNFYLVLGAMAGFAVLILGVARWRDWI